MAEFSFTYRAFISYAHADHDDAVWLHRALERYRVPRRLAGAQGLRRIGKVFRDEVELAAAAELGPKIDAALRASDVLIVVCSPRSAKSVWVNEEITAFKALGREGRVFALIIDGEPHGAGETECFPEALKHNPDGRAAEPLAVDVRKFGREDAALRIVAGLLDVGYDDLKQRDRRRRRAELRQAQALFVSGLMLVAAALTGGWFAANFYVAAAERNGSLYGREAHALSDRGQYAKAMLVALAGDPAAQANPVTKTLRPAGYQSARAALVRAFTHNRLRRTMNLPAGYISQAAFSYDASLLAIVGDRTAVWSTATGKVETDFRGKVTATSVAFVPDGRAVLFGGRNGAVLLPVGGGEPLARFVGHGDEVTAVAVSSDGQMALTASRDHTAVLWSIDGALQRELRGHDNFLTAAAFSPDSSTAVTGDGSGVAKVWSAATGELLATLPGHGMGVSQVSFSPDGSKILVAYYDATAEVWPFVDPAQVVKIAWPITTGTQASFYARFSPDGTRILTGAYDGAAVLWSLRDYPTYEAMLENEKPIAALGFSPDGETALTLAQNGDLNQWSVHRPGGMAHFADGPAEVTSLAYSPDGANVLTGSHDGVTRLWSVASGKKVASFSADEHAITSVAYAPDGKTVLVGSDDGSVRLWSLASGKLLRIFSTGNGTSCAVAYSPDGRRVLAVDYTDSGFVWEAATGEPVAAWPQDGITVGYRLAAAFSPDGVAVAQVSGGAAMLRALASPRSVRLIGPERANWFAISYSPDGRTLLLGGSDGLQLMPADGGAPKVTYAGTLDSGVNAAAFSADGRYVLAGFSNGSAMLWAVDGGMPLAVFSGQAGAINAVAFAPDGRSVALAADDGTTRVWAIPHILFETAAEQVQDACAALTSVGMSVITVEDRRRYPVLEGTPADPCAGR